MYDAYCIIWVKNSMNTEGNVFSTIIIPFLFMYIFLSINFEKVIREEECSR